MEDIKNNPAQFFMYQHTLESEEVAKKAQEFSRKLLNTKQCILCDRDFDLQTRAPRILIHCGHTLCTACLYLYFKDS